MYPPTKSIIHHLLKVARLPFPSRGFGLLSCSTLILLLSSCSGPGRDADPVAQLDKALTMYNQTLRWGPPMTAISWVAPESRDQFMDAVRETVDKGKIVEVEMEGTRLEKDKKTALAFITFSWTEKNSISIIYATQKQTWVREGAQWQIKMSEPADDDPQVFLFSP